MFSCCARSLLRIPLVDVVLHICMHSFGNIIVIIYYIKYYNFVCYISVALYYYFVLVKCECNRAHARNVIIIPISTDECRLYTLRDVSHIQIVVGFFFIIIFSYVPSRLEFFAPKPIKQAYLYLYLYDTCNAL